MASKKTELVVALDIPNKAEAFAFAEKLSVKPVYIKIGWGLYPLIGHDGLIGLSKMFDGRVFLDFKLHDIPTVIAKGVENLMRTVNFRILTLHASGGQEMMSLSIDARNKCFGDDSVCTAKPILLGVTVLTSMNETTLKQIGSKFESAEGAVLELAKLAKSSGMDGVVSAVSELKKIKSELGSEFVVLTPGIRPSGSDTQDQARVATPSLAKEYGSDYIVVGRPIIQAENPLQVVDQILHEIE
jgi:orotidine-5'-phosphate decarboxylase